MNPIPGGWRDIPTALDRLLAERPDAQAVVGRHASYTHRELDAAVNAGAAALQALGVGPGDRVAASAPNHPDILIAFLASQRLGAIWVGINRPLAAPEKLFQLQDSGARVYLADAATIAQMAPHRAEAPGLEHIVDMEPGEAPNEWMRLLQRHAGAPRPAVAIDPHAPAAIGYTSGTTGRPKGAVHSQHNMILITAVTHAGLRGSQWRKPFRYGASLPMTILNIMILEVMPQLLGGGVCVILDRVDAGGVAEWVRREQLESVLCAPATFLDMARSPGIGPADLATLEFCTTGGSTVSIELRREFEARIGAPLFGGYGMTEAPTEVAGHRKGHPSPPDSCGQAAAYLKIAALGPDDRELPAGEVGELCIRAADAGEWAGVFTPMLEYWGRPEASAETLRGGWLHTGDVGYVDEAANLFLKDRLKDVIIRGGANIYPAEVERVLKADTRIRDAAILGLADERLGEIVAAFVELAPGVPAGEALEAELKAACLNELARYKVPEIWTFVPEMPRNSMNKIVKGELRKLVG